MILNEGDGKFVKQKLMPYFRVRAVKFRFSPSRKVWPDIWVEPDGRVPVITVTREWRRQDARERRKRLVHEIGGHIAFGWKHNEFMDKVGFSTHPNKDTMSWRIYRDLMRGKVKSSSAYIREALSER